MLDSVLLINLETQQSLTIDKNESEFVLGDADFGTVEGSHHTYKYVNQIGVYINSTSLEQRAVSIEGWVIGDTYELLRDNKAILNRMVNPQQTLRAILYDEYSIEFKPDYSVKYSVALKENNEVLCKFLIQGTCANPMFTTKIGQQKTIASVLPKFRFPLVIPKNKGIIMGLRDPNLLSTINNRGDVPTGMKITFSCTSTVVNPSLLNVNTREFIKINKVIPPGETIVVSTQSDDKYIVGINSGVKSNYFKYLDFDSSWLQLELGENLLKYDADDNPEGLDVLVEYSPQFLEVQ